jgi:hypothetical protein
LGIYVQKLKYGKGIELFHNISIQIIEGSFTVKAENKKAWMSN